MLNLYCSPEDHGISIYNPNNFRYELLENLGYENGKIPISVLEPTFILIKYCEKATEIIDP